LTIQKCQQPTRKFTPSRPKQVEEDMDSFDESEEEEEEEPKVNKEEFNIKVSG